MLTLGSSLLPPSAALRPLLTRAVCFASPKRLNFKEFNHFSSFSAFKMAPTSASEVPKWVDDLVEGHQVTVFSKSYCPHCKAAISALSRLNISDMLNHERPIYRYAVYVLRNQYRLKHVEQIEDNPFCDAIQDYLKTKTGARSVPRVFLNGKFFGGGDDTVEGIKNGTVERILRV